MRVLRCLRVGLELGLNLNFDVFVYGGDGLGMKRVEREV